MREWIDGLEQNPEQAPAEPVSMEHPHLGGPLFGAYLVVADAIITYEVHRDTESVSILHIGQEPPEYMS